MIKERKIESIRFETKAVIYQNETGFKILAGVSSFTFLMLNMPKNLKKITFFAIFLAFF